MASKLKLEKSVSRRLPEKTTLNLAPIRNPGEAVFRAALVALLFVLILVALYIYGIQSIEEQIAAKEATYASHENEYNNILSELTQYREIQDKYSRYSYGYMSDTEAALLDRVKILDIVRDEIIKYADVENISVKGNSVTLQFTGMTLEDVAELIIRLEAYPEVLSVALNTASSGGQDGNVEEITSSIVITMENPPETEAEDTADTESGTEDNAGEETGNA